MKCSAGSCWGKNKKATHVYVATEKNRTVPAGYIYPKQGLCDRHAETYNSVLWRPNRIDDESIINI